MKLLRHVFKKNQPNNALPLLEAILQTYKTTIGKDFEGYRNHCYRVFGFCQTLNQQPLTDEEQQKLQIALAFHDLGLFTDNTVDYLPPSMKLADDYLQLHHKSQWRDEILLMIEQHHKITPFASTVYPLVELLRQADLVDFSLGLVRHGVSKEVITQLKKTYPNRGFHKMVIQRQLAWLKHHADNPFPIFKL